MSKNVSKARAERCVTHYYGCDCREYRYQEMLKALEYVREMLIHWDRHDDEAFWIVQAAIKRARGE
jgi:hypothetical protein